MTQSKWIAHERINTGNKINLLCFIFDGGSASYFAPWKNKIAGDVNLVPILYPVREKRRNESMYESMSVFVKNLVEDLPEIFQGRYAFFGYCSGSIIAYEAAVYAKTVYGTEPEYGMIVSSEAPRYLCESVPVITEENSERLFFEYMSGLPFIDEKTLHDKVFLEYFKPLFAADYGLLNTYAYTEREKLHCAFDVIMCPKDPKVQRARVDEWRQLTDGDVRFIDKAGGHFLVEVQEDYIIETLNDRLSEGRKTVTDTSNLEEAVEATAFEWQIIQVWKNVFKRDDIHPMNHFFLMGGDSLKAVKIINAVNEEFGVSVSINDIFSKPKVRDFADYVLECLQNREEYALDDVDEGEL